MIEKCNRKDAGKYELLLENPGGSKMVSVNVKVLDSPGAVDNLGVKEVILILSLFNVFVKTIAMRLYSNQLTWITQVIYISKSVYRKLQFLYKFQVTKKSALLMWDTPKYDGGAAVTHYIVEKRLSTRKAWTTVSTEVKMIFSDDEGNHNFECCFFLIER